MTKLPSDWKIMQLSEIGEIVTGNTPSRGQPANYGDDIVWIKPSDLDKKKFVNTSDEKISNSAKNLIRHIPKGSVLVSCIGIIGKVAIADCDLCTNQQINSIIPNNNIVDSEFLYYTIKKMRSFLQNQSSSAVVPLLNKSEFSKIKVIIPPLFTQKKIALILEKAEKLKELRMEADNLTKDYLKAVFVNMFGDTVTNSKKWEVKKMKDISKKIVNGTTPKGGKQVYVKKGIVFFRSQNVWNNRLSLDDVAYIDDDTHAKMRKSSLKNKDILMTKTGRINTENSSLGRSAMFLGEDNTANINGHVYLIRLQENIIPEFVLFVITTDEYREYIRSICVGGIDKRQINKEHLQKFPIIFPPVELQNKFVSIVKEVEAMKEQQKQSRIQIHNLFNHLMQKAFKGELVC